MFQTGTSPKAKIGINTNAPGAALDVVGTGTIRGLFTLPATGTATAASGKTSQPQDLVASAFNSGTSKAVAQTFQFKAEPINNNTANPSGTLNLLFGSGTGSPTETGFKISNTGVLTFVATQKFPGAGTVTSVGSGAGLTGGPITTSGTLSIANGGVMNAMLQHSTVTITAGTDLTGGGAVSLGGSATLNLDTAKVPQLATTNTFTGAQTINNNLTVTGSEQFTGPIQFTDGTSTEIINAIDCCNFGTRMIWAHSPAFPTWGIFYDDSIDFMHWRTAPGGELLTADFPDHRVGINNVAPTQALDVVGNIQSSGIVSAASDVDAAGNANVSGFVSAGGDIFGFIGSFASDVDLGGSVNASGGVNASGRGTFGSSTAGGQIVIANNNGSSQALQIQNFASPVGGFTEAQFDVNGRATFFTDAFGDTTAVGTKSAAVPLTNGAMVKVFSTESPEVWFEDYGFGQLASGASKVTIDPGFAQTANMTGYHVFVTPKGDCKGLYVTNETGSTFEVRELEGGQSNIAFDYRIVAHRKGYETVRLPAAHMPQPHVTPALVAAKVPVRPPLVSKLAPEPARVNPQSLYRAPATMHKQVQKH